MSEFRESRSEIIRATHIFLFTVGEVEFGEWERSPNGTRRRRGMKLTITINEVLKGRLKQEVGSPFTFTTTQYGPLGRISDYMGVWADVDVESGVQFLAFCTGQSTDARVLLTEPYLEQLLDPATALNDVRAALQTEERKRKPSAKTLLSSAAKTSAEHGVIYARYLWARIEPVLLTDMTQFERVMAMITAPETEASAREFYINAVYEELTLNESVPQEAKERFIRALFAVLTLREIADDLYRNVRDVFLPNMLRAANDEASAVFANYQDEYAAVVACLSADTAAAPLLEWLHGGKVD